MARIDGQVLTLSRAFYSAIATYKGISRRTKRLCFTP